MLRFLALWFSFFLFFTVHAQSENASKSKSKGNTTSKGFKIEVKLDNYPHEMLKLGYHFGDKQYIRDSAKIDSKSGAFVFEADTFLESGVYLIIMQPDNKYFQVLLDENEQQFSLKADANSPESDIQFKGSPQNTDFYAYMKKLSDFRKELDEIKAKFPEGDTSAALRDLNVEVNKKVRQYQKSIYDKNPKRLLSGIISFNFEMEDFPVFSGSDEEVAVSKFYYTRDHYFDFIDVKDSRLIRTPLLFQKVDYYVNKMHAIMPDSTLKAVESVLTIFNDNQEVWRFFLSHFLNTYYKSKYVGMDLIYVHLVENYYEKGMAPWVSQENLDKIVKQAKDWKPLLLGKKGPNITMQKQDGSKVALHDIKSDFIVLMFWAPDCGHCQKSMPEVVAFADKYKDKGVTVMAVCGKLGDVEECWKMVESKKMQNFLNVTDANYLSRFKERYDVQTTPKIFILDKNKTIISKNLGPQQLDEVVGRFIEMEKDNRVKN
jgi:thiol-disulfide isomerase/thioredoxin